MGKLYKFGNEVENLIDLNEYKCNGVNSEYTYDYNLKQYTIKATVDNRNSGISKDCENVCELNKIYTIGYKIKAESNIKYSILINEYKAWNTIKTFASSIESNGKWIEIKHSFTATKESYKFIFAAQNCAKGSIFYLKDMFLIQGDYTNKKLPDSLF